MNKNAIKKFAIDVYAVQESNGINRGQLKYFGAGLTDAEKNVAVSTID